MDLIEAQIALKRIKSELNGKEWLSLGEASRLVGKSNPWFWLQVEKKKIDAVKDITKGISRDYRKVKRSDLIDFIQSIIDAHDSKNSLQKH